MKLNTPYYIEKRDNKNHISLDGEWSFCYSDADCTDVCNLDFPHKTTVPASVYRALHIADLLPDPYTATNNKKYHWVDEKVWYYKKTFTVNNTAENLAYLCFDGIGYYSKVWLNGHYLGNHEGMFGGPVCDVSEYLNYNGENEITVEFKACNYGKKDNYDARNTDGKNREIVPWAISRDKLASGMEDFIVFGIWNSVRIEFVPQIHISRPYIYTKSITDNTAQLHFEMQITDGKDKNLNRGIKLFDYMSALTGQGKKLTAEIKIFDGNKCISETKEEVALPVFHHKGLEEIVDYYGTAFFYQKNITIKNPRLWYPVGMGDPHLYSAQITLSADDKVLDKRNVNFGIRIFSTDYTEGNRYCQQPGKFRFSINGKEFFLKGMNWMPIDQLYDISPDRYEWCLTLAKNAGIQLLRVWNGGGIPETDDFYNLCDRLGIMVWQDQYIANTNNTQNLPTEVIRCQCAYNLFRTRNHPSLVVICGGNEFNPYSDGNAAAMAATEQTCRMIAPDKEYRNTSPDTGSGHLYIDMEPVWYRHGYSHLPFLAESGLHSFPNYKTLTKFISKDEATSRLSSLGEEHFKEEFPELLNHFIEYDPTRVPQMLSRVSQIYDIKSPTLPDLCEASQVQGYEFYQLMIQSMHESYPICGGIMPWAFKRPWATVGVQTVDGDDRPTYVYYAVQNSYRNINIAWCQDWSVIKVGEQLPLKVKVFNQNNEDLSDCEINLTIYNPDLTIHKEFTSSYEDIKDFGTFAVDEIFRNTCFLVSADISANGKSISRSVYFNKCTDMLEDEALYTKLRTEPCENLYFENGPFLKDAVSNAKKASVSAHIIDSGNDGRYNYKEILIKNNSDIPAYPVTVDVLSDDARVFLSENFFLLKPYEEKTIRITQDKGEVLDISVKAWNAKECVL